MMVFREDGTLLYFVEAYGRVPRPVPGGVPVYTVGGAGIYVARSHDGGKTFPAGEIKSVALGDRVTRSGRSDVAVAVFAPT